MQRITQRDLDDLVTAINKAAGTPTESWDKDGACIGNYHINYAYGGTQLQQTTNTGGGVKSLLGGGYVPKRELYEKMSAFLTGLRERK